MEERKNLRLKLHSKRQSRVQFMLSDSSTNLALRLQAAWTVKMVFALHSKHPSHSCYGESQQAWFNAQAKEQLTAQVDQ